MKELKETINACAQIIANHICHCWHCKEKMGFDMIDQHKCKELSSLEYISPRKPSKQTSKILSKKSSKKSSKKLSKKPSKKPSKKLSKRSSKKSSKILSTTSCWKSSAPKGCKKPLKQISKKPSKQNSKSTAKTKVNLGRIKKQKPQFDTLDV